MPHMLVSYYSRTHHTQHMAQTIAEAARTVGGVQVDLKASADLTPQDLLNYQAIVIGSPTYYGSMAGELKKLLDDSVAFHGQLTGRVGGAFVSSANPAGGAETTILSILQAMLIHGMIVQGSSAGDHYGPVAIGDIDQRSHDDCQRYGHLLAELTARLHR